MKLLDRVQRRAMKMVKGLKGKPCEEWLRYLGLFTFKRRTLMGDFITAFTIFMRGSRRADTDLLSAVTSDPRDRAEVVSGKV